MYKRQIDSYITYMDNIVSVISGSEDAQYYLFRDNPDGGHKKRLLEQFSIILKGRSDIRNIGLVCDGGTFLFNTGYPSQNPDLDLSTQEWYRKACLLYTSFTDDFDIYYKSMRLTNVLFGTLLAFVALRLGKRLFEKEKAWFFAVLVTFLPGAAFLHTYQNMDSLALLATAWIFYCWVRAVQEGWTGKVCMQLGLAMSLCVMSYYNAYGFLLCSALLFAGMMLKCGEQQWNCLLYTSRCV